MRTRPACRNLRVMPAFAADEMAHAACSGLAESEVTMIRALYAAVQQRCSSRDRSRRIAAMREREIALADLDQLEAMASQLQLAEIRALPEAFEPHR
jgi:crotonobetainyl-CoA:carnitine CoA-transferase CaiB-like acyl-CoA transferase